MNRTLITTIASVALAIPSIALAETNYSVFKVCEDKHVIRTSDGQEAGHVEYIVVDPDAQRIVSTVVTGGVEGDRLIAVPYSSMRFGEGQEVTLTEINRERLVSAPVIERSRLTTSTRLEPTFFERSYSHFGVRGDASEISRSTSRTSVDAIDRGGSRTDVNVGTDRAATRSEVDVNGRSRSASDARDPNMRNQRENVGTGAAAHEASGSTRSGSDATATDSPDRKATRAGDTAGTAADRENDRKSRSGETATDR